MAKTTNLCMYNKTTYEFTDISSEKYRVYSYESGYQLRIDEPTNLSVSKAGGHRVLDAAGKSYYIPKGWVYLYWEVKEGEPNFVK